MTAPRGPSGPSGWGGVPDPHRPGPSGPSPREVEAHRLLRPDEITIDPTVTPPPGSLGVDTDGFAWYPNFPSSGDVLPDRRSWWRRLLRIGRR